MKRWTSQTMPMVMGDGAEQSKGSNSVFQLFFPRTIWTGDLDLDLDLFVTDMLKQHCGHEQKSQRW